MANSFDNYQTELANRRAEARQADLEAAKADARARNAARAGR